MIGPWIRRAPRALGWLIPILSVGCGSIDGERPTDGALELFTWWSNPGEVAALDALLDAYGKKHPQTGVAKNSSATRIATQNQLETRMTSRSPPDTFQTVGGADLTRWVTGAESDGLEPVGALAENAGLTLTLPNVIRNALSHQGQLYAIPLDIPRLNVLFYNTRVLSGNQLSPPTTLTEFYAVAEALSARGIVPLALGTRDGSVVSQLLFDAILVGEGQVAFRDSFLEGDEDSTDARIAAAVAELAKVLSYTNTNHDAIDWPQAARMVIDGSAGMMFTGEWARAFFASANFQPGTDLGQIVFPGTQGTFVYLIESFTIPNGAPHRQAAVNFLQLIGSQEAANTFGRLKRTTPARLDFNASLYDPIGQQTATEFRSSTLTLGHIAKVADRDFLLELDATLRQFALDKLPMPVVNMLRNRYGHL